MKRFEIVQLLKTSRCHCERPKEAKQSQNWDCFVAKNAPRNDKLLIEAELLRFLSVSSRLSLLIILFLGLFGGHFDAPDARAQAAAENKGGKSDKKETCFKEVSSLKQENSRLEKELAAANSLNNRLEAEAKKLYIQAQDVKDVKQELKNAEVIIDGLNKERMGLKKENELLQKENSSQAVLLKKERGEFYQELGAAYGSAGNFEKAIEAYNRSLQCAPDNTRIYYYLGLLYKQHLDNSRKAVYNFKKYLEYNPGAEDKEEVEYLIKFMSN